MERAAETTTETTEQPLGKGIEVTTETELEQILKRSKMKRAARPTATTTSGSGKPTSASSSQTLTK